MNMCGVFSSFFLQLTSELQVSRRCCVLVADDAWCVPIVVRTDAVLFGAVWKVRHESISSLFSRPDQGRRGHCDAVCEGFEGNPVVGACELITYTVPDYDHATRNGTEIWLPARERVLQLLV